MAEPRVTPREARASRRCPCSTGSRRRLPRTRCAAGSARAPRARTSWSSSTGGVAGSRVPPPRTCGGAMTSSPTALTRLVAELVLRPPDLRHLDAAFTAFADQQRNGMTLRESIDRAFASRCGHCGGPVVVEEFVWDGDADAPSRRSYRCGHCRETRAGDTRTVPVDAEDIITARRMDPWPARDRVIERFPVPDPEHELPDQLLDLYTAAPAGRHRGRHRPDRGRPPGARHRGRAAAAARGHAAAGEQAQQLPGPRGAASRGRRQAATGRRPPVAGAQSMAPARGWLPHHPRLRAASRGEPVRHLPGPVRPGPQGAPGGRRQRGRAPGLAAAAGGPGRSHRPRVAVASGSCSRQPPVHWSPENLAFAYLATSLAIGLDAALTLPLDAVFESGGRQERQERVGPRRVRAVSVARRAPAAAGLRRHGCPAPRPPARGRHGRQRAWAPSRRAIGCGTSPSGRAARTSPGPSS